MRALYTNFTRIVLVILYISYCVTAKREIYKSEIFRGSDRTNNGTYDYIIIGGGATGCPFARTMADAGKRVLIIERGRARSPFDPTVKNALNIHGAGAAIMDENISQTVKTTQGVRTHIGNVMGGGTAINMGIGIEETSTYFEYVQEKYNETWDMELVEDSYDWIEKNVYTMPQDQEDLKSWTMALEDLGFKSFSGVMQQKTQNSMPAYSRKIRRGFVWGGYSLFNSEKNFTRAAADVLLYQDPIERTRLVDNVTLLTNHTVSKILFEGQGAPKARCVRFHKTTNWDFMTIGRSQSQTLIGFTASLFRDTLWYLKRLMLHLMRPPSQHACISTGGEIILAAGAVYSTVILFNSGIGPKDQMVTLGIKPILHIPELGKNFGDRPLVAVPVFRTKEYDRAIRNRPRICPTLGLNPTGPNCQNHTLGNNSFTCTDVMMETISGDRTVLGVIVASRYIVPPSWRDHPATELFFDFVTFCLKSEHDGVYAFKVCKILQSVTSCSRRALGSFYMLSEPRSRGSVRMNHKGQVIVNPNYFSDQHDIYDLIRGVRTAINVINTDRLRGFVEPLSSKSCPFKILNTAISFIATIAQMVSTSNSLLDFFLLQQHFELLNPDLDEIQVDSDTELEDVLIKLQEKERKAARLLGREATNHTAALFADALEREALNYVVDELSPLHRSILTQRETCQGGDVSEALECGEISLSNERTSDILHSESWVASKLPKNSPQWAASYPPILPHPDDPIALARYGLSIFTSVWHHFGTARRGTVVNNDFNLKGVERLSIVDASVWNMMTRANPTVTLMMQGRYVAQLKLNQAKTH